MSEPVFASVIARQTESPSATESNRSVLSLDPGMPIESRGKTPMPSSRTVSRGRFNAFELMMSDASGRPSIFG